MNIFGEGVRTASEERPSAMSYGSWGVGSVGSVGSMAEAVEEVRIGKAAKWRSSDYHEAAKGSCSSNKTPFLANRRPCK